MLITGLGALGTVFATFLKKAGHSVFALTRDRHLSALQDRKVRVFGIWGEHEAGESMKGKYSLIAKSHRL
jgi:2-dehydropantoate 2-reductase